MIDYLKRTFHEDVGIAFVYCNYNEKGDQTVTNLIASLLQQLIQRHPIVPNKIRTLYEQHICKRTRPTLAEYSELLRLELTSCPRAFVVVDALDECDDSSGTRSSFIADLLKLPPTTYLMITSRDLPSIESELGQFRRLEIRASDADVRIYLERRIATESRLKRHIQADPALENTILETIVKKVEGMLVSHTAKPNFY